MLVPSINLGRFSLITWDSDYCLLLDMCLCVFFPFILDIKFVGRAAAGVTQEEGHTGFFIPFLSAVRALVFLARRIRPFLSLIDREVEFCVLTIFNRSPPVGIFFFFFCEKNSVYRDRTHVSTYQKVTRLPLSYRGNRIIM